MAQLIGSTLLGSKFIQDPNPLWVKINDVAVGDSYGYKTITDKNIGNLLTNAIKDSKVVCVVYNWNTGIGYIKSGFNLKSTSDYTKAQGYTTFIVKSQIAKYTNQVPVKPIPNSSFVNWDAGSQQFICNSKKFVPVGVNCFGLGLCQEYMNYFSHKQITEIFDSVKKLNGTTIRSHTLGFSASSENSLLDYNLNFREAAWDPIDFSLSEAKRTGIKVMPIFSDPYEYYHGSYKAFCTNGVPKEQFFTHPTPRNNFKKFISGWLNHVNKYTGIANKNCSDIFALELGNELGQQRFDAGSTAIPTKDWLTDISNYIKSIAPNILTLCPTDESLGQSSEFSIKNLDIYSQHFYGYDYNRMSYGYNNSKNVNKPYIIGEYSSQFGQDWFDYIERLNIHGSFSWSIYPHESNRNPLNHDDGFTFWYNNKTQKNNQQLLLMSNHFRRMQGLKTITQLQF